MKILTYTHTHTHTHTVLTEIGRAARNDSSNCV